MGNEAHAPSRHETMEAVEGRMARAKSLLLTVRGRTGDETVVLPFAPGSDGIYCAATADLASAIRRDPRVSLTIGEAADSVSGTGRAIILDRVPDECAAAGISGSPALRIIPAVVRVRDASGRVAEVEYPYGGRPKGIVALWVRATRPFAFSASVMPVLVGAALAWYLPPVGSSALWWLLPAVLAAAVLFHTGTNLISDYHDFMRGVDRVGTLGGSGILVNGLMPPRHIFWGGMVAFAIGIALGLGMVALRGLPLLAFGVVGFLGGFLYCGWPVRYKYRGLGELGVFALMGPLMVAGSYYALTGGLRWEVLPASLPVGLLVAAILQANDVRDIADDRRSGITTMSLTSGRRLAAAEYLAMIVGAYLSVVVMIAAGILPVWTLLVFLSIPPALKVVRLVTRAAARSSEIAAADVMTAQLHLAFCGLLIVGILLGKLL